MSGRKKVRVAIDGPAGAGKSTVSRQLAERLGYLLLDTGALYRTVALAAVRGSIRWDDGEALGALAMDLVTSRRMIVERSGGAGMRVCLDGEDVSSAIRTPEVSLGASRVQAFPSLMFLRQIQQASLKRRRIRQSRSRPSERSWSNE